MQFPCIRPPKFSNPRRAWTLAASVQLVVRIIFLCVWAYLGFSQAVLVVHFLLGRGPWLDLGIYAAITVLRSVYIVPAVLSSRTWLSEVWFDICSQCIVIGIDTAYIIRMAQVVPSTFDFSNNSIYPPFDQLSWILIAIAIICISLDILISATLVITVLAAARQETNSDGSLAAWRLGVLVLLTPRGERVDLPLNNNSPAQPDKGRFTFKSLHEVLVSPLRTFLDNHTVYRRDPTVEPAWLAFVRGTTALIGLTAIFTFGVLNILVNPTEQFQSPLPKRPTSVSMPYETGFPDTVYGVTWFKQVVGEAAYLTNPFDVLGDRFNGIVSGFFANASLGDTTFPCEWYDRWRRDGYHQDHVDLGIEWRCWDLRQSLEYSVLDGSALSPILQLRWNTSADLDPILRGHVANTPIWEDGHLWAESFGSYLLWNVSVGTTVRLNLGRRLIKTKSSTFLDMVGLKLKPVEIVGYPAASATFTTTELSSQTIIEIVPSFGGFYNSNADAWEEYLEHTMLEGLAATGGLYTSFDLVFALIFGRSLIYLLSGAKPLSPFGAIGLAAHKVLRKKLLREYPCLESGDASQRSGAVCDFMCDFVLDMGPIQPTRTAKASPDTNLGTPN